jgi:Helix-turn-helix domain
MMSGWLDLKRSAEYTSLSVRTLRRYIGDPHHPLPVRIVGGKWLAHPADLDTWIKSFPAGKEDIDHMVNELIAEVKQGEMTGGILTR